MRKFLLLLFAIPFLSFSQVDCVAPANFNIIGSSPATVIVTDFTNFLNTFEIVYGPEGFDPETEGSSVTTEGLPFVTLEDLEPGTVYDVYVRTVCEDGLYSDFTGPQQFETDGDGEDPNLEDCLPATDVLITNVTQTSANVAWTNNSEATQGFVVYVPAGTEVDLDTPDLTLPNVPFEANDTTAVLNGLEPGVAYDIYIITICLDGNAGLVYSYSEPETFTTEDEFQTDDCPTPLDVEASVSEDGIITVTWENADPIPMYGYAVAILNEGEEPNQENFESVLQANSYSSPESLEPGNYVVYVVSVCDADLSTTPPTPVVSDFVVVSVTVPEDSGEECEAPQNFSVNYEDGTSATVTVEGEPAYTYEVIYGEEGFDPEMEGTTVQTNENFYAEITGLNYNTTYDVYVRTICDTNYVSDLTESETFTTEEEPQADDCPTPLDVEASVSEDGIITVTWENADPIPMYGYAVAILNEGEEPNQENFESVLQANSYSSPESLEPGNYVVYVVSVCDADLSTTPPTPVVSDFVIVSVTIEESSGNACDWTVHVWANNSGEEVSWELLDAAGDPILSGGDYDDNGYDDTQTVTAEGPLTFWISNEGFLGDNVPNYSISNGNGVIAIGTLASGDNSITLDSLNCDNEAIIGCDGTPNAGIASTEPSEGFVNSYFTSSATGFDEGDYLTYEWQFSFDGGLTWANGESSSTYQDLDLMAFGEVGDSIEVRLAVSCMISQEIGYSTSAYFEIIPEVDCTPFLDCTDGDLIINVTFEGIDNTTDCSPDGYGNYTDQMAVVEMGGTYPISVTVGDGSDTEAVSVWIDFDNSGTFDDDEFYYIGTGGDEVITGSITIPSDIEIGDYRMRVRVTAGGEEDATSDMACDESQYYGETEDYTVTVIEPTVVECETPEDFFVDYENGTSAFVVIDGNPEYTYEVVYGPEGFDPSSEGTSVFTEEDPIVEIGDLDFNTTYDVYVRTICDEDNVSDFTEPQSFTTEEDTTDPEECLAASDIEFNSITDSSAVVTWTNNSETAQGFVVYAPEGTEIDFENPDPNLLYVPFGADESSATLNNLDSGSSYDVYIVTICAVGLDTTFTSEPETFTTEEEITDPEECETPEDFFVDYENGTSAFVVIDGNPEYTYEVVYGPEGFDPSSEGTSVLTEEDPIVEIGDLDFNTTYDVYVRTICDEDNVSDFTEPQSFTTEEDSDYCIPSYDFTSDYTSEFSTSNALTNVSYSVSSQPAFGYDDQTAQVITVEAGDEFDFSSTYVGGSNTIKIWVDWNNDGSFDESEIVYNEYSSDLTQVGTILVPEASPLGDYRMRVRSVWDDHTDDLDPCGLESFGSAIDFTVTVIELEDCTEDISAGETEGMSVCAGVNFTLTTVGASEPANGLVGTWEEMIDGEWVAIEGANSTSYTVTGGISEETQYRFIMECEFGGSSESNVMTVSINPASECYCEPTNSFESDYVSGVYTSDALIDINYETSSYPGVAYIDETNTVLGVYAGQQVEMTTAYVGGAQTMGVWVDWNQNGVFGDEADEQVFLNYGASPQSLLMTVPSDIANGNYRMRVRGAWSDHVEEGNDFACNLQSYGTAIDFTVTVIELEDCTEDISAGETEDMSVCSSIDFTLTTVGASEPANGLVGTWEEMIDGEWVAIEGANSTSYTVTGGISEETQYRYTMECEFGGLSESNVLTVSINPVNECYCEPDINFSIEPITLVEFAGISNSSPQVSDEEYEDFTAISGIVEPGLTYPISLEGNTNGAFTNYFTVFIDFNENGILNDEGEMFEIGSIFNSDGNDGIAATGNITIPADATSGVKRIRVIKNFSTSPVDPCGSYSFGQIEDYSLEVIIPDCPAPLNVTVTTNEDGTLTVDWTGTNPAPEWGYAVAIMNAGETPGLDDFESILEGTSYTSEDVLEPGNYEVHVVAVCDVDLDTTPPTPEVSTDIVIPVTIYSADACEWTVHVWDDYFGDEVQWQLLDADGGILLSGGSYGSEYDDVQSVIVDGSVIFTITNDGLFGDNTPNFMVSNGSGVIIVGSLPDGGATYTSDNLTCEDEPIEGCVGTPNGGVALADPSEGISGAGLILSASQYDEGDFLSYEWEYSFDGGVTWQSLGSSSTYEDAEVTASGNPGDTIEIRLAVTCILSGETGYSTSTFYTIIAEVDCVPFLDCTDGDVITNVTFEEIDNTTDCSPNGYGDYTDQIATVEAGNTYPISVTVGDGWDFESVSVWIDYDNSGTFDADEFYYIGTGSAEALTGSITIPADLVVGDYRMRVRVAAVGEDSATDNMACDEEQVYGETEDYTVKVISGSSVECDMPEDFYVDYEGGTSAFVVIEGDPANTYEVVYGPAGFDPTSEGTSVLTGDDSIVEISGLDFDTTYDVYVRTICDDENASEFMDAETFTTEESTEPTECDMADGFEINYDGETTATVVVAGNPENTYEVVYGPAGFDPATEGTSVLTDENLVAELSELDYGTTYDVYVRTICDDENMSDFTDSQSFTTEEEPVDCSDFAVTIEGEEVICEGSSTILEVVGADEDATYLWNNGSTDASIEVTNAGTYSVIVTSADGCVAEDAFEVSVTPLDEFEISVTDNLDGSFTFEATGIDELTGYVWEFGDTNSSTEESPTHTYGQNGLYTVTLTVPTECGDISTTIIVDYNTIDVDESELGELLLFPNPSTNYVNVAFEGSTAIEGIVVLSPVGQIVFESKVDGNNYQIDVSHYAMGVYYMNIILTNGEIMVRNFSVIR